jgi:hypothetical protein
LIDGMCDAALHVGSRSFARRSDPALASAEPERALELRAEQLDLGRCTLTSSAVS